MVSALATAGVEFRPGTECSGHRRLPACTLSSLWVAIPHLMIPAAQILKQSRSLPTEKRMSHVPIAFLLLGALAPLYTWAVTWERTEKSSSAREARHADRAHRESSVTNVSHVESSVYQSGVVGSSACVLPCEHAELDEEPQRRCEESVQHRCGPVSRKFHSSVTSLGRRVCSACAV